jgi:hypothetical protein
MIYINTEPTLLDRANALCVNTVRVVNKGDGVGRYFFLRRKKDFIKDQLIKCGCVILTETNTYIDAILFKKLKKIKL